MCEIAELSNKQPGNVPTPKQAQQTTNNSQGIELFSNSIDYRTMSIDERKKSLEKQKKQLLTEIYEESAYKANRKLSVLYRYLDNLDPFIKRKKDVRELKSEEIQTIITEAKKININNRYVRGEYNNAIKNLETFHKTLIQLPTEQYTTGTEQQQPKKMDIPEDYDETVKKVNDDLRFLHSLSFRRKSFSTDIKFLDAERLTSEEIKELIPTAKKIIGTDTKNKYVLNRIVNRLTKFSRMQENLTEQSAALLTAKTKNSQQIKDPNIEKKQIYENTVKEINKQLKFLYKLSGSLNIFSNDIKQIDTRNLTPKDIENIISNANTLIYKKPYFRQDIQTITNSLSDFSKMQEKYPDFQKEDSTISKGREKSTESVATTVKDSESTTSSPAELTDISSKAQAEDVIGKYDDINRKLRKLFVFRRYNMNISNNIKKLDAKKLTPENIQQIILQAEKMKLSIRNNSQRNQITDIIKSLKELSKI